MLLFAFMFILHVPSFFMLIFIRVCICLFHFFTFLLYVWLGFTQLFFLSIICHTLFVHDSFHTNDTHTHFMKTKKSSTCNISRTSSITLQIFIVVGLEMSKITYPLKMEIYLHLCVLGKFTIIGLALAPAQFTFLKADVTN